MISSDVPYHFPGFIFHKTLATKMFYLHAYFNYLNILND